MQEIFNTYNLLLQVSLNRELDSSEKKIKLALENYINMVAAVGRNQLEKQLDSESEVKSTGSD